jgi:LmbE family N-acetylglucosaminyl deacetylase
MTPPSPAPVGTALLIAAHPDDPEFGAGGIVAHLVREGWRVVYVLCTRGEQGTHDPTADLEAVARLRMDEQQAAARVLGVSEVTFLSYPDGLLEPTLELRRDLTREIRRYAPQRLICQSPVRVLEANALRRHHPDHLAAGTAALAAVYPSASSPHLFPELLAEGFAPCIVPEIYVGETATPEVIVNVADVLEQKVEALLAHRSQVEPEVAERAVERARRLGQQYGLAAAEAFQLIHQD